jgi:YaiO family outer membrane protein
VLKSVITFIFFGFIILSKAQEITDTDSLFRQAQKLAFEGAYQESREMSRKILKITPEHFDAAILMGRTYAWQQEYDSARIILNAVLEKMPATDVLFALAQVERWTGNMNESLDYVNKGLEYDSCNPELLLLKSRALQSQNQLNEAMEVLEEALLCNPDNDKVTTQLARMKRAQMVNQMMLNYQITTFSQQSSARHFANLEYMHTSPIGKYIVRGSYAEQNELQSLQAELETYLKIDQKTNLFLSGGISDGKLFASYRAGAEIFYLFPYKIESSIGARGLFFPEETVVLYTGHVGKYFKKNWISLRTFLQRKNETWQPTGILQFRQYLKHSDEYISLILAKGSIPSIQIGVEEIYRLNANSVGVKGQFRLNDKYLLGGLVSYEQEEYFLETYRHRFTAGIQIKRIF